MSRPPILGPICRGWGKSNRRGQAPSPALGMTRTRRRNEGLLTIRGVMIGIKNVDCLTPSVICFCQSAPCGMANLSCQMRKLSRFAAKLCAQLYLDGVAKLRQYFIKVHIIFAGIAEESDQV